MTSTQSDSVIESSGVVGTNGNILLLGLGSIKAANRTLNDIQTEVRNILIRNGLAPSFQLEISKFKSKKAFVIGKTGSERQHSFYHKLTVNPEGGGSKL